MSARVLEDAPPHVPSRLEVVKDNIEAFAVAIVMALVIKHFCVEAFKIPSGSMLPTLEGSEESGDRILVDKLAYLFHGPRRWDVVVFRYPLDASRNFIKRILGLPGETIKVAGGDIWVRGPDEQDFHIATKRRRVREQMYECGAHSDRSIWPQRRALASKAPAASWQAEPPGTWRVESEARIDFAGGSSAGLTFLPEISAETSGEAARDVRVRTRATADAPATLSWTWVAGEDLVLEVRVSTKGFGEPSAFGFRRGSSAPQEPLDLHLEPGRPLEIEAECVDGEWIVSSGGSEKGRLSLGLTLADASDAPETGRRLVFRAAGGAVRLEDLRIDRDLHYIERQMHELVASGPGVTVPEDSYFALGDNTESSSDSRAWTRRCLTLRDGRSVCYDAGDWKSRPRDWDEEEDGPAPPDLLRAGAKVQRVVDVSGAVRWWDKADEVGETHDEPQPFVRRDLVVGRAFFVFWPLLPHFPNRLGFIH